jgi:glycosyltransferase involved in cell wall biosynthesis
MKILYFSPTYSPITHGPALTAQILSKIQGNHSFEIRIVAESFEFEKPPNAYLIQIPIIRIFHAWGKWIRMWLYHKKAKEIYKDYAFDYLIFNDALLGLISSIAWGNSQIQIWGFCNDSAYMKLSTNVNKGKFSFLMDCLHAMAEFGMMHFADGIFTCSEYLRKQAILFYKVKREKIKCLYPGISLAFWHFKEREFNQFKMREEILFVKSDYKNGGLSVLLNALLRLNGYSFRLHLVGTPIQQEANLQKLLSKFPTLNILTYGQLPPFKVRELMYQCDTLCIPSLNEGFGIVNVEGLATGISVVSTLTGGIPEVLPFEKYGWTVPPEDDFALAEMLESCWTNKEERLRRAKAGRKMVEAHFTSQHLQDNFIKCLVENEKNSPF